MTMAVALPLVGSLARGPHRGSWSHRHARHHHSRAWWRRHRALLKRRRAAAALRRRQSLTASNREQHAGILPDAGLLNGKLPPVLPPALGGNLDVRGLTLTLPEGWRNRSSQSGVEIKFQVNAPDGRPAGEASLAPVAHAVESSGSVAGPIMRSPRRTIAGVPFTELRRIVIDKMVAAGGWVVNDVEREIGGRRVFVVLAQTGENADGRTSKAQAWSFYFTEVDGRVYSFAAHAPLEYSDRMAAESEKVMASLRSRNQAAATTAASAPR
jgi:hypothetical protein